MRIAVVTDYGSTGGASIAASRLCTGLRRRGHFVGRFYAFAPSPTADSADVVYPVGDLDPWNVRISGVLKNEIWRRISQRRWAKVFRRVLRDFRPDVVSLHNLHGACWDIEVVEECLRHAPVTWTLHDMWALTGSCAYSLDCLKFESACDARCPRVGTYPTLPARMIASAHARRRRLYNGHPRLALVAPSRWLTDHARVMAKGCVSTLRITYGLDLDQFRPIQKSLARDLLRIPDDGKPCLLAAAAWFRDPIKGMNLLVEALATPAKESPRLMLMGRDDVLIRPPAGIDVVRFGALSGDKFFPILYSAADLFVQPSLAENQPLVIMEAMACGVPVVALSVGGVPEMVVENETGWLAKEKSAGGLAEALRRAMAERAEWPDYAERCRARARAQYAAELQARRYEQVMRDLVAGSETTQETLDGLATAGASAADASVGALSSAEHASMGNREKP